jgi:enoyl-CoA hydratase/carnithine racemase
MKVPSGKSLRDAVLFGKRLSARDSRDLQLVDVISSQQSLSDDATKLLFEVLGKNGINRKSLKQTKEDIYCFPEHLFVESTAKL